MSKDRVLIVNEDVDVSKMLQIYFTGQGYETLVTNQSKQALLICRTKLPKVILLDIHLPHLDSYLDSLQRHNRTKHIPIIYIVPQDHSGDKFLNYTQTDNFVTIPFDIEELKQRLEMAVMLFSQKWPTHQLTNLPTGQPIEEQLREVKRANAAGVLLFCSLTDIVDPHRINEVINILADVICETIETYGHEDDFIGHSSDTEFILITEPGTALQIRQIISQRFYAQIGTAANLFFREVGGL